MNTYDRMVGRSTCTVSPVYGNRMHACCVRGDSDTGGGKARSNTCSLAASEKMADTSLCESPNHFDCTTLHKREGCLVMGM